MKKTVFILALVAFAACNNSTSTHTQDTLTCDSTCSDSIDSCLVEKANADSSLKED